MNGRVYKDCSINFPAFSPKPEYCTEIDTDN